MAPAPTRSRRRSSTSSSSNRRRLLIAGAIVLAAVLGYVLYRHHSSSSSSLDTSGTPGPDRTGSNGSLAPSGGAAGGDAGQLPASLVSQPDPVQQQVQTTDAGAGVTAQSPTSTGYSYVNPRPGQTTPDQFLVGGQVFTQSSPGSDAFVVTPAPSSHPGSVGGGAPVVSLDTSAGGPRRPGVQL